MRKLGKEVPPPEDIPEDMHTIKRKEIESPTRTTAPANSSKAQLKKFLQYDRKVLRFYCYWDNRENLFGERKPFVSFQEIFFVTYSQNFVRLCITSL